MQKNKILNEVSACHFASAAKGIHDKDKEITLLACFLMEQKNSGTFMPQVPAPLWLRLHLESRHGDKSSG